VKDIAERFPVVGQPPPLRDVMAYFRAIAEAVAERSADSLGALDALHHLERAREAVAAALLPAGRVRRE